MIESGSVSVPEKHAFIGFANAEVYIEHICQECSEKEKPPEAFLASSRSIGNSLLAASVEFLEDGQLLAWPGLQLVGQTFDPDWGFARAEIELHHDGSVEFQIPHGQPDTFTNGDIWGYRFCPIENHEIPDVIRQLAHIRTELTKPKQQPNLNAGIKMSVTELRAAQDR